jgi:hypothetical protein
MSPEGVRAMEKRRWLGRQVWIVGADGTRRSGTLWWDYGETVLIRQDGLVGLHVFAKETEGLRWGFAETADS